MKQNKGLYVGIALVIVVVVLGLVVVKSSDHKTATTTTATSADTSSAVATNAVNISNYMFDPMVIKVKVGTTVTWTNKDSVHHSVTADTTSSDAPNSSLFGQNETYRFTFKKAGTYTFHCIPHPYMHGTVVVTE
ncbi:MAG: plastocyanin/azurin family copper-binding protein [Candidatus Saccharimonadales bacterium]